MATIDDLDYKSITDMNQDEALELIRQIRLSRRTPTTKAKSKKKSKATPKVDANQAAELLKLLTGGN